MRRWILQPVASLTVLPTCADLALPPLLLLLLQQLPFLFEEPKTRADACSFNSYCYL
jgi:hypothetical protein